MLTTKTNRIESIDLLRGFVMIIMVLDHVRDFFHADAFIFDPSDLTQTTPFLFFTRWITNFCAPVFMFLAGVSAYLYGAKKGKKALSNFLLTRGLWLIFADLFIVSPGWFFNFHFNFYLVQVICAFGISMIVLSALVHAGKRWILAIAVLLIAGHNLLDSVHVDGNGPAAFGWAILHVKHLFTFGPYVVFVLYPVLPWIGVMGLGYYLGSWYTPDQDAAVRKKRLIGLGWTFIGLFILLRGINLYGDPAPWKVQASPLFTFLSFIKVSKYPPSLLYILVTLGPALLFLAYTEKPLNAFTAKIAVFGRVALFFYVVHIYLVHALAVIASMLTGYTASNMTGLTTWVTDNPLLSGYGFSLGVTYLIWALVILIMFHLSKWFDRYKRSHIAQQKWLSYL